MADTPYIQEAKRIDQVKRLIEENYKTTLDQIRKNHPELVAGLRIGIEARVAKTRQVAFTYVANLIIIDLAMKGPHLTQKQLLENYNNDVEERRKAHPSIWRKKFTLREKEKIRISLQSAGLSHRSLQKCQTLAEIKSQMQLLVSDNQKVFKRTIAMSDDYIQIGKNRYTIEKNTKQTGKSYDVVRVNVGGRRTSVRLSVLQEILK